MKITFGGSLSSLLLFRLPAQKLTFGWYTLYPMENITLNGTSEMIDQCLFQIACSEWEGATILLSNKRVGVSPSKELMAGCGGMLEDQHHHLGPSCYSNVRTVAFLCYIGWEEAFQDEDQALHPRFQMALSISASMRVVELYWMNWRRTCNSLIGIWSHLG
ncbi:hypothetical protein NE237_017150 [Protea cynaroides]|uniref:Uncharacterized protein n=1 Tax=Protea cynaroides TaxID=273540 RepID=A0A9Q0K7I3_9MAGN|nr:hypothetical protein NE237_017150 [Protea cynaroides]